MEIQNYLTKSLKYTTVFVSLLFIFNSCQFEKECYYGCLFGECIDGTCYCDDGWSGIDCRIQKDPSAIKIYRIDIISFPQFNPNGGAWDNGSNPDIYILFRKGTQYLYLQPNYFNNAIHNHLYSVYPQDSITITDLFADYSLSLIDYDESSQHTYMGGIGFKIYNDRNDFPATIVQTYQSLSFRMYVKYEWN
jgi:hypothetical protein